MARIRKTRRSSKQEAENRLALYPHIQNHLDPQGMVKLMEDFLEWMKIKNYSFRTIERREELICHFMEWAGQRSLSRPDQITKPILERYQRSLYYQINSRGQRLSFHTQNKYVSVLKAWFKWLAQNDCILFNPASELSLAKETKRLPKAVLSEREVEVILSQPDVDDPFGLRDRAILETFYSTGIRRFELADLKLSDTDEERGTIIIREGKGHKDRMIPIGDRALGWIKLYTEQVRPELTCFRDEGELFLNQFGEPMGLAALTALCGKYVRQANIGKTGSCHIFRHAMATHMLENGADIRYVQSMLGHAKLETTQIYTQIAIKKLKEVHTLTHPAKSRKSRHDVGLGGVSDEGFLDSLASEGEE